MILVEEIIIKPGMMQICYYFCLTSPKMLVRGQCLARTLCVIYAGPLSCILGCNIRNQLQCFLSFMGSYIRKTNLRGRHGSIFLRLATLCRNSSLSDRRHYLEKCIIWSNERERKYANTSPSPPFSFLPFFLLISLSVSPPLPGLNRLCLASFPVLSTTAIVACSTNNAENVIRAASDNSCGGGLGTRLGSAFS